MSEYSKLLSKIAELTKESEKDVKIDFLRLEDELVHNQNLIGKWMTYQQVNQTKLQFIELEYKKLVGDKMKYYTGKMSEDEIISKGWQIEGTKILKSDVGSWMDSDPDALKLKKNVLLQNQILDLISKTLDILIDQKKWTIKNYIDWKKWLEGN
jgi:molybdenum cofactor biosynthesis enzyme MoaA